MAHSHVLEGITIPGKRPGAMGNGPGHHWHSSRLYGRPHPRIVHLGKAALTIGINPRIISHMVSGGKSLQSHIYTRLEPLRMQLLHGKGDTPITGAPKPM